MEEFAILKGVHQYYIWSPMLFNLYVQNIFVEALENTTFGIKLKGHPINYIGFADNTAIITDNQ